MLLVSLLMLLEERRYWCLNLCAFFILLLSFFLNCWFQWQGHTCHHGNQMWNDLKKFFSFWCFLVVVLRQRVWHFFDIWLPIILNYNFSCILELLYRTCVVLCSTWSCERVVVVSSEANLPLSNKPFLMILWCYQ